MRWMLAMVVLLSAAPAASQHEGRHGTGRTVLTVEVRTASTERVALRCGVLGPSLLPVTARVLSVEEGTWPNDTIVLDWPTCSTLADLGVVPGARFRIRVRVGALDHFERPRPVRWSQAL